MSHAVILLKKATSGSLVKQIIIGIVAGVSLAVVTLEEAVSAELLGKNFVGTFMTALTAVTISFFMPTTLPLVSANISTTPPDGIGLVLYALMCKIIDMKTSGTVTLPITTLLATTICSSRLSSLAHAVQRNW